MIKFNYLYLLAIPFILILSSCSEYESHNASLSQQLNTNKWHTIQEKGIIRIGVKKNSPPFSTETEEGEFWGFDIDIATQISNKLGVRMELIAVDAKERIPFLKQNKVDIIIATMTQTLSREEKIDFTIPYFQVQQGVLSHQGSEIESYLDLYHKNVGVVKGTQTYHSVKRIQPNCSLKTYNSYPALLEGLNNKEVEAIVSDELILLGLINKPEYEGKFKLESQDYTVENYAIAVAENQSDLRDQINHSLMTIWEEGTWQDAFLTWFSEGSVYGHELNFHIKTWPK